MSVLSVVGDFGSIVVASDSNLCLSSILLTMQNHIPVNIDIYVHARIPSHIRYMHP